MTRVFDPAGPESPLPPSAPPPAPAPERRGFFAWIARRPGRAFAIISVVSLFIGLGIGAASATNQAELDRANARADRAEASLAGARDDLSDTDAKLTDARDEAEKLDEQVAKLKAKGEVPSFTGMDVDEAGDDETIETYDWRVKTRRVISTETPGTVLDQTPNEGKTLKSGRSITLTVAKKAPPKPKQWVTLKTLQGASSTKTPEFTIPEGVKARLVYSMPGDGNNAITLYQAPDEYVDLMLNEIGPQSGSTRIYDTGTYYLDVTGAYDIQVQAFKRP
jgi:hypothetical protein